MPRPPVRRESTSKLQSVYDQFLVLRKISQFSRPSARSTCPFLKDKLN